MGFDLDNLEKKREELREKIEAFENQKQNVRTAIEKLAARYNIGEINFKKYHAEYKRIFKDKTPEQWTNYFNIQIKACEAQLNWYDSEIKNAKSLLSKKEVAEREKARKKAELRKKIEEAESYKKSVLSSVQALVKKYNAREITFEQYQSEIKKLYHGNEPQKLVDYYDWYISNAKKALEAEDEAKRIRSRAFRVLWIFLIFGLLMYGLFGFVLKTELTGLATFVGETHTKVYDVVVEENAIYDFDLPYEGNLNWVKLSGKIRGEGSVRIYLEDILILDSDDLESDEKFTITGSLITGLATEGSEDGSSGGEDSDTGASSGGEPNGGEAGRDESSNGLDGELESFTSEEESEVLEERPDEHSELPEQEPSAEIPKEETGEIIFRDYCKESCNLSSYRLNKKSYALRVEVDGAELVLNEIRYGLEIEKIIYEEENITIVGPPVLLKEIPNIVIEENSYFDLDVNEHFKGAVEYYLRQADNISTTVFGNVIRIEPQKNFTGVRKGRIVVVNEFGSIGSNLFNISVVDSENFTLMEKELNITSNVSLNVTTKQFKAVINRPVRWAKIVKLDNVSEEFLLEIPIEAENMIVKTGQEADRLLEEADDYESLVESVDRKEIFGKGITGNVVNDLNARKGILTKFFEWLKRFTITGRAISEDELADEIIEAENSRFIDVSKIAERTNEQKIAVEYYTPAPSASEEVLRNGKRVTISGPHELNYTDILAYTVLDERFSVKSAESIKVYWRAYYEDALEYGFINETTLEKNSTYVYIIPIDFDAYDLDEDGRIDYVEWIVPHLSNQTYEIIIEIVKAEHLDSERNFIADIYEEVKALDGIWSEEISDGEYVRVWFEQALKSNNDITIYLRMVSGNPRIEVYEINGEEVIAEFESLIDNEYNKVYLTNLVGEQDAFDLRVVGGSVEIEHIIDPTPAGAWCYQESANISTSCGGLDSGVYWASSDWVDLLNTYDGNWGTYGIDDTETAGASYLYVNYSKPSKATNESVWQVRDGDATANLTIDSDCWSQSVLQFRVKSEFDESGDGYASAWSCWNGTTWKELRSIATGEIYEEAMIWYMADFPQISFVPPTPDNSSSQLGNSIYVNLSTSDSNDHYAFLDFNNDVLLWMTMDDVNSSGDPTDLSSYSRNGTKKGNAAQTTTGYFGKGFSFDGDGDYINLSGSLSSAINPYQGSFSVWANYVGSSSSVKTIVQVGESSTDNNLISMRVSTGSPGNLLFRYRAEATNYDANPGTAIASGWHHYVGVWNLTHVVLYIDGAYNTSAVRVKNVTGINWATIGTSAQAISTFYWNGSIDEVLIFNRSLSAEEIKALYNASSYKYQKNFTNLALGEYSFTGYVVDKFGNKNQTEKRKVTLQDSEEVPPEIRFELPTPNNKIQSEKSIYVNLSTNDSSRHYSFLDLNNDVLLWMTMDDVNSSGDPTDLSSYSRNGTKKGNAAQTTTGYFGKAFGFDGAGDYIDTNTEFASNAQTISYSVWVKPNTLSNQNILIEDGAGDPSSFLQILDATGKIKMWHLGKWANSSSLTLTQGAWNHIIAIYNTTNIIFYINNVQEVRPVQTSATFFESATFKIGKSNFNGSIDEVLVFSRALTAEEVAALYNSSAYHYQKNFTSLSDGSYNFQGFAVDAFGNKNQTEVRTVTIHSVSPIIRFLDDTPSHGSFIKDNYFNVSINATDDYELYAFLDLNNDVLLWMTMDDVNSSGDPTDLSSYSHNGTKNGDAVQTNDGYFGKGFSFDGTGDYVRVAGLDNNGKGYYDEEFTVSAWIYPNSGDDEPPAPIISDFNAGGFLNYGWSLSVENGVLYYRTATGAGSGALTYGSTNIENAWHHVAVVGNGTNTTLYVDGEIEKNQLVVKGTFSSSQFWIGGRYASSGPSAYFKGRIDDVLLFNRSLSAAEIKVLYNATVNKYSETFGPISHGESHTARANAVDIAGNRASATTAFSVDKVNPLINFTSPTPANGSTQGHNSIFVNITSSDSASDTMALVDIDNSLLLWYNMEDVNASGDPIDLSSYSRNGTAVGGAFRSESGMFGKSFRTDGSNQYVRAPEITTNLTVNGFTQSMWFKFNEPPLVEQTDYISYFYAGAYDSHFFRAVESVGTYSLQAFGEMNNDAYLISKSGMTSSELTGRWHHLASVYNLTHVTFYVNGERIGADETSNVQSSLTFTNNYFGYQIYGKVDEVMLFNRSLTEAEILALYNATANKLAANLTGLSDGVHKIKAFNVDRAGNRNETETREVNISTEKTPVITYVQDISSVNPLEDGVRNVSVNITVYDGNGYGDISLVYVNFTRAGEPVRRNESCALVNGAGNYANYTCSVGMWYFDEAGEWDITAYAIDNAGLSSINDSVSFTYNLLTAIKISPASLDFGAVNGGGANVVGASTLINNTGNYNAKNISITGHDLFGQDFTSILFGVGNFTANVTSDEIELCSNGFSLINATEVNITTAILNRGNHSVNDGSTGQEEIYYCIPSVPALPTQEYSTYNPGTGVSYEWVIKILFAVFVRKVVKKKRKKRLDEDNLLEVLDEKLVSKYGIGLEEVLVTIKKSKKRQKVNIPIDVFKQNIGPAEAITKYLKENEGMSYSEIAKLIGRDQRTVWVNYSNASRKIKDKIVVKDNIFVPSSVLADRRLSILESVVVYLRGKGMKNAEVAALLGKDPRNIWTLYSRAVRKLGRQK